MAPGQHWAEVRAYLENLDTSSIDRAAQSWLERGQALSTVQKITENPEYVLDLSGGLGNAAYELREAATHAADSIDSTDAILRAGGGPTFLYFELTNYIAQLAKQMAEDEAGGPLGFGALPDPSAAQPSTAAGSLIRDLVLQEYDQRAEVYLARLREKIAMTASDLDKVFTIAPWPPDLPQADPDAPGPVA